MTDLGRLRPIELATLTGVVCCLVALIVGPLEFGDADTNGPVGVARTLSLLVAIALWVAWIAFWLRRPDRPQRHWLGLAALLPIALIVVPLAGPDPSGLVVVSRALGVIGVGLTCWLPGSPALAARPPSGTPESGARGCRRPPGAAACPLGACPQRIPGASEPCLALTHERIQEASGRNPVPTIVGMAGVSLTMACLLMTGAMLAIELASLRERPAPTAVARVVTLAVWVVWLLVSARRLARPQQTWLAVVGLVPAAALIASLVTAPADPSRVFWALGLVGVALTCWIPGGWAWRDRWPFVDDWPFTVGHGHQDHRLAAGGADPATGS